MPNRSNWHCDNSCTPRCECNAGYVRNFLGSCIEETECPNPFCPVNEEVSTCYNYCEDLTCDTYNSNLYCPPVAADKCTSRCKCKAGYVRNSEVSKKSLENSKKENNYYRVIAYYQQPVQILGVATMPAGPRAAVQLVNQRVLNQISKPA